MPFAKIGDLNVYFERAGAGAPLLFISGSGADLRIKPNQMDGPLPKQFDVLSYDQRGLGQTSKPDAPYTMADYADDAARLMDHRRLEERQGDRRVVRRHGGAGIRAAPSRRRSSDWCSPAPRQAAQAARRIPSTRSSIWAARSAPAT